MEKQYFKIKELAGFGIALSCLRSWYRTGRLKPIGFSGKTPLFSKSSLEKALSDSLNEKREDARKAGKINSLTLVKSKKNNIILYDKIEEKFLNKKTA